MIQRSIGRLKSGFDRHIGSPIRALLQLQGFVAAEQLAWRAANNPLLRPPLRFFSQNDEDGITLRILGRLLIEQPAIFFELGVGNGLENNTLLLLALRWRGAWVGAEPLAFSTDNSRLTFVQDWVTKENCIELASRALWPNTLSDIKFASLDVDGNDYHVAAALLNAGFAPDIFVVEYNAKFPPPANFVMQYDPAHHWAQDDYFGASLASLQALLKGAGYQLIACNLTGVNAFFIKNIHSHLFDDVPKNLSELYMPGTYLPITTSGHPSSARTVEQMIRAPTVETKRR
jgi:hypothetical protein